MIHLYGLVVGVAIVVGWSVAERIEPKVGRVVPWILIAGLVGARAYHVIDLWMYYSQNWREIWMIWQGGLGIFGGVIGGYVGFWVASLNLQFTKKEKWSILGAMATGLPLAQAIGRVGNWINGEFVNKVWILPWWATEAVLDLMLFVLLRGLSSKARVGGYLVGYGLIRLVLEPFRESSWWVGYGIAGIFVVVGAGGLWYYGRRRNIYNLREQSI